ncbi:hypothetical protein HDU79_004752 [Rhizoclosmatium sp. JEL0117]|nr:hypothetical protein HDU79_004752 [Rhizoclosmatium sp. JEL0117]
MNPPSKGYSGPLTYGGGRLLQAVKVYPIFVGSALNPTGVNAFYASLVGSTQMDALAGQYDTTGYKIRRGQFVQSFTGSVSGGSDPASVVKTLLKSGVVTPDANSYFPVHYGPEYDASVAQSCTQYCAYHDSFSYNGQNVAYGMIPNCASTTCHNGYLGPTGFDSLTCIAAHELFETVTDPDPTSGWNGNGEIGDICYGQCGIITGGDGKEINVQYEWSNYDNACILASGGPGVPGGVTTTAAVIKTTTTTIAVVKTTTTGIPNTKVTTTQKQQTTTSPSGGNKNLAGQPCTSYGGWACNNSLVCSYGAGSNLVWVQVGSVSSC